jgi:hypothetical protein
LHCGGVVCCFFWVVMAKLTKWYGEGDSGCWSGRCWAKGALEQALIYPVVLGSLVRGPWIEGGGTAKIQTFLNC